MSEKLVEVVSASGYAALDEGKWSFYYGREWAHDEKGERWGFRAERADTVIVSFPLEAMEAMAGRSLDPEAVADNLLLGIDLSRARGAFE